MRLITALLVLPLVISGWNRIRQVSETSLRVSLIGDNAPLAQTELDGLLDPIFSGSQLPSVFESAFASVALDGHLMWSTASFSSDGSPALMPGVGAVKAVVQAMPLSRAILQISGELTLDETRPDYFNINAPIVAFVADPVVACWFLVNGTAGCGYPDGTSAAEFPNTRFRSISPATSAVTGVAESGVISVWEDGFRLSSKLNTPTLQPFQGSWLSMQCRDAVCCGLTVFGDLWYIAQSDDDARLVEQPGGVAAVSLCNNGQRLCFIRTDATLWCWDDDLESYSQFGPGFRWESLVCEGTSLCAVDEGGNQQCWQIVSAKPVLTMLAGPWRGWLSIDIRSGLGPCGVTYDRVLVCWPHQLGTIGDSPSIPPILNIRHVSFAEGPSSCWVTMDGGLGCSVSGIAEAVTANKPSPADRFRAVATISREDVCALTETNALVCETDSVPAPSLASALAIDAAALDADLCIISQGQQALTRTGSSAIPSILSAQVHAVSCVKDGGCAIQGVNRSLVCFGAESASASSTIPGQQTGTNSGWIAITARRVVFDDAPIRACAIHITGTVHCWGGGGVINFGTVPDPTPTEKLIPPINVLDSLELAITSSPGAVSMTRAELSALYLRHTNTTIPDSEPLFNAFGYRSVSIDRDYACAVTWHAELRCWGQLEPTLPFATQRSRLQWDSVVVVSPPGVNPSWPSDAESCARERRCQNLTAALQSDAESLTVILRPGPHVINGTLQLPERRGALIRMLVGPSAREQLPATIVIGEMSPSFIPFKLNSSALASLIVSTAGAIDFQQSSTGLPGYLPMFQQSETSLLIDPESVWTPNTILLSQLHTGIGGLRLIERTWVEQADIAVSSRASNVNMLLEGLDVGHRVVVQAGSGAALTAVTAALPNARKWNIKFANDSSSSSAAANANANNTVAANANANNTVASNASLSQSPSAVSVNLRNATSLVTWHTDLVSNSSSLGTLFLPASLTAVSAQVLAGTFVRDLDISHTAITVIPTGFLQGAVRLENLLLPPTVQSIAPGALSGAMRMQTLDLRTLTSLTVLEIGFIANAPLLSSILLPASLTTIAAGAFQGLPSLTTVDLSPCTLLTNISVSLCAGASTFETVIFPVTLATVSSDTFSECKHLTALDLSTTQITSLPSGTTAGLSSVSTLRLPSTLTAITDGSFTSTPRLAVLDLSATAIRSLSAGSIRDMPGVVNLLLPAVLESVVPGFVSNMSSLTSLNLSSTAITHIPASGLSGLTNSLADLTIGSVSLDSVGVGCDSMSGLTSLTRLTVLPSPSLSGLGSPSSIFTNGSLAGCAFNGSIEELAIRAVNLSRLELGPDTFSASPQLRRLSLVDTGISHVETGFLTHMSDLVALDLSLNAIDELPILSQAISNQLLTVILTGNPLSRVSADAFRGLGAVSTADIDDRSSCEAGTALEPISIGQLRASVCALCPPGSYCLDGIAASPCPLGTFLDISGAANVSECIECGPQSSTTTTGAVSSSECQAVALVCSPGTGGPLCHPCAPGTASKGGQGVECGICPAGSVSAARSGSIDCLPCTPGTYASSSGRATLSECEECGAGLAASGDSATCSACRAGWLPSRGAVSGIEYGAGGLECVECGGSVGDGLACMAGVWRRVPTASSLLGLLETLELASPASAADGGSSGADGSSASSVRRLADLIPTSTTARKRTLQSDAAQRGTTTADVEKRATMASELGSLLQTSLAIAAGGSVILVMLFLCIPWARRNLSPLLTVIDGFSIAHQQPRFSAVRVVPTAAGGVFTIAALIASLSLASTLVVDFAVSNRQQIASLTVAADGAPGADIAAVARGDIALDMLFYPVLDTATPCATAILTAAGSLAPMQATASSVAINAQSVSAPPAASGLITEGICHLSALCMDCPLSAAASLRVDLHWSVQAVAWRLGATDADGRWQSTSSTVSQIDAQTASLATTENQLQQQIALDSGATTSNATWLMLQSHTEDVSLVAQVATDETITPNIISTGFVPQRLLRSTTTARSARSFDPSTASVTVSFVVGRSAVFSGIKTITLLSPTQLLSAVAGVIVGALGAFSLVFRVFEARCGRRLTWLCGQTGIIATEEQAKARALQLLPSLADDTTRPKLLQTTLGALRSQSKLLRDDRLGSSSPTRINPLRASYAKSAKS